MGESYNNICRLCDLKGISIGKLCSDIGMSRGIMTELKSGRTKQLGAKNLIRVAEYLGVSVDEVLGVKTDSPPPVDTGLVDRIRHLCKQSGLSLTKLEAILGFGNGTIGRWKSCNPTYESLKSVADYFAVSIEYLAEGEKKAATQKGSGHSPVSEEVANIIDTLPDVTQEQALRLVRYIYGGKAAD